MKVDRDKMLGKRKIRRMLDSLLDRIDGGEIENWAQMDMEHLLLGEQIAKYWIKIKKGGQPISEHD